MKILDNFLPDLELVKRFIDKTEYGAFELEGKKYTGVGQVTLPVKALIEKEAGPISIKHNHLRIGRKDTPLTHYIHTDRYGTKYGFVLCLSAPDCSSGTAFWTHKETGLDRLPENSSQDMFQYFDNELKKEDGWFITEMVESVENRALVFEADRFHSRWPMTLPIEAMDKPRIVCTVFFDRI